MQSQTVIRRRKGDVVRVTATPEYVPVGGLVPCKLVSFTPESTFLSAYEKVNKSIGVESMDYLQTTAESILSRMKSKEIDLTAWEFKSIENMTIYIKGCVKKRQIKTEQSKAVIDCISFVELSNNGIELADTTYTPKIDLFDWICNAKRYDRKPLFSAPEKELIVEYYEKGKPIRRIAKEVNTSKSSIQRQLESISQRLAKLPIRDMYGFIESQGVKTSVRVEPKEYKPLATRIGLLRRYRRTKDKVWLDKYNDNSDRVLTEHECRIAGKVDTKPIDNGKRLMKVRPAGLTPVVKVKRFVHLTCKRAMRLQNKDKRINRVKQSQYNKGLIDFRHLAYWTRLCKVQINPFDLMS